MESKTTRDAGATPKAAATLLLLASFGAAPSLATNVAKRAPHSTSLSLSPLLSPIGVAVVVWNQTHDACPYSKWVDGVPRPCEEPDSMPIAWHNPVTKTSMLISATDCTYATVGPSLDQLERHDCTRTPYKAVNDSRPWTYANHQWLQSARVFANGTGFAFVHNEFHGEQEHNRSYCSFDDKTSTGQCIFWSTDVATTVDGGATWHLQHAPVITLPRRYLKDAAIAGYGELGSSLRHDRYYYAHVSRHYNNNTGAGPPDTVATGTCVFRTADPTDPATYRGWNGTEWSTTWFNPYTEPPPPVSELWRHSCADVDLGGKSNAAHLNPKKFAGPLTEIPGWPTHVMTALQAEKTPYYYPTAAGSTDGAAPFTAWASGPGSFVNVTEWMDPCTVGGGQYKWMYPNLIDHSSPFALANATGEDLSDGLSYGLIGNESLYLYAVLSRRFIVRIPVAFFLPGQSVPAGPFTPPPPPPLNPSGCTVVEVTGAGISGVDGTYSAKGATQPDGTKLFELDVGHEIYHYQGRWIIGRRGHGGTEYYTTLKGKPEAGVGVPLTGWGTVGRSGCPTQGDPIVKCTQPQTER